MFEIFDIGLWSSMREQNLIPIMELIKSKYEEAGYGKTFFKFCLHQGHCEERHSDDGRRSSFNVLFVKNFRSQMVAPYITGPFDTILVDDNPEKAIENPSHTLITLRSYEGASNDNVPLVHLLISRRSTHVSWLSI
ncbi:hypothetical protein GOP47_0003181 [Adiantum capillus-veneris]|uniref:FCP1 homology domain-containing protein n=1 Tax=Adiantum capillus-veneris TaxID=13818 RepID=A0A9D4ZPW0_ADICA|nr:hypothetical protein GOP47_0003181 [Adiantum capillus-veneris]